MKEAGTVIVFLVSSSISSFRVITLEGKKNGVIKKGEGVKRPIKGPSTALSRHSPVSMCEFQSSQILTLLRSCCRFLRCLVCM